MAAATNGNPKSSYHQASILPEAPGKDLPPPPGSSTSSGRQRPRVGGKAGRRYSVSAGGRGGWRGTSGPRTATISRSPATTRCPHSAAAREATAPLWKAVRGENEAWLGGRACCPCGGGSPASCDGGGQSGRGERHLRTPVARSEQSLDLAARKYNNRNGWRLVRGASTHVLLPTGGPEGATDTAGTGPPGAFQGRSKP